MDNPIRLLLVDDNLPFLEVARGFLELQKTFEIAGTAIEGSAAFAQALNLKPDVILLDLNLGNRSSLGLIPIFREILPQTKIVVLTMMEDELYRAAAIQAGADDFVSKSTMSGTLVSVILRLMKRHNNDQKTHTTSGDLVAEAAQNQSGNPPPTTNSEQFERGADKEAGI